MERETYDDCTCVIFGSTAWTVALNLIQRGSMKWKPGKVFLGTKLSIIDVINKCIVLTSNDKYRQVVLTLTWVFHQALRGKWLNFLAQGGGGLPEKVSHLFHHDPPWLPSLSKHNENRLFNYHPHNHQPTSGPRCSLNLRHVRCSIILIIFRITRRSAFVMSCKMIMMTIGILEPVGTCDISITAS